MAYDTRTFEFSGLSRCVTGGGGEGGEKKEKHSPYDLEHETLQGVSSCCAKTHIRTYDVTPDLRWHGQQLPYSSLLLIYVFTDYSTSVHGILPHKLLRDDFICFTTHIYELIAFVMVSTRYNENTFPRTSCNVLVSIYN